jgi:hypothetical protein
VRGFCAYVLAIENDSFSGEGNSFFCDVCLWNEILIYSSVSDVNDDSQEMGPSLL